MPEDYKGILLRLTEKVKLIFAIYEQIKDENQNLIKRNSELEQIIIEKEQQIKELEKKYTNIKLANALISEGEDKGSARTKVNRIVREIDKCIALLNR